MRYLALIADIESSKSLPHRAETQERLERVCKELNARKFVGVASPFTVTLGDEVQALFADAAAVWESVLAFEVGIHPARMRFSLAVGTIETSINRNSAVGMDGPAFHEARDGIEILRENKTSYRVTGLGRQQALANSVLGLISLERESWNHNRLEILSGLLKGESAAALAEKLEISQQAIYKNMRRGGLEHILGIFEGLRDLIDGQLRA